jgi:UDP-N-acetylmuramate dehydrogenase
VTKSLLDCGKGRCEPMSRNELQSLARERGLEGELLHDEPLRKHTSYRIGGPADLYVRSEKQEQLCGWIRLARELGEPYLIIGGGTNLLVGDKGFRGLVVENRCLNFTWDAESPIVHSEAGVPLALLARQTAKHGLAGLEWAVGIPGTVGGAIVNNAGAYSQAVANVVSRVTILDGRGSIRDLPLEELKLDYRTSRFRDQEASGDVILSTDFTLTPESTKALEERMARYDALRRAQQPRKPSAGSVFKNPPGLSAGQLIEQAGLKGRRLGNAQVSPRHANYIVNLGAAKAEDVLGLIKLVRQEIWQRFGVELELEIELVGECKKGRTI